ncbi:NAD(P)-dependent oxidoreductase [Bacillus weihaiensis]|uniref:NAD(P)-dependent oxidoreductase n=1 Tax=Bacillus weihaiensis TaxID=1547283 RepID=UPI003F6D467C
MKVKKTNISLVDLASNFDEVEEGLSKREAYEEANRCLYCYDAPCITACPTGIDIPSFIKKISTGNLLGSAKTIMASNPVGASCSRVCPTEELCEGACVLNHSTEPIMIGNLQRYATDWAIHNEKVLFQPGERNGKTVAVIGSGPAGLSAARELALLGYQVTIFEAKEKAGGLNTYGIVSFRLPQSVAYWEINQVEKLHVEIRTNTRVGVDISVEELLTSYDSVILAIGMASVPRIGIEGEEAVGVYDAIDFVKETKMKDLPMEFIGKKVAVIGAGNTAIDAATCSVRLGAEHVKIIYRRTVDEMTAYDFEYEFAKQDGVEFRWLTSPQKVITDDTGKVTGLQCIRMELSTESVDGRRKPVPIEGSEFVMKVDAIIRAIGQSRHSEMLEQFQVKHHNGVVHLSEGSHQTSNPMVFACGDVIFGKDQGEAMVVSAAQQGKLTAYELHEKLGKQSMGIA